MDRSAPTEKGSLTEELVRKFGLSSLAAKTLIARGITEDAAIEHFLHPSLERDWLNPFLLSGMEQASSAVLDALAQQKPIVVYGDFDVDGMTATALLVEALRAFGGEVYPFIPERFSEGYGLSKDALERVCALYHPALLITVDNGIGGAEEVRALREKGIQVVVTDHHRPERPFFGHFSKGEGEKKPAMPADVALVDPQQDEAGPSQNLSGAGVALKLVQALEKNMASDPRFETVVSRNRQPYWRGLVDLAMLGTVADIMLLDSENRALVSTGIAALKHTKRPGFLALCAELKKSPQDLEADELSFSLIPHLNAAGRMGKTEVAFDLLMCKDRDSATRLAAEIVKLNSARRRLEEQMREEVTCAAEAYLAKYPDARILILPSDASYEGVKGIVAGQLARRYKRPVILVTFDQGRGKGSGRSVGELDLFEAVSHCSEYLVKFGGHKNAVGITVERARLEEFQRAMEGYLAEIPAEHFLERPSIVAEISLSELSVENIAGLEVLRPFGNGNRYPLFSTKNLSPSAVQVLGPKKNHLKILFETPTSGSPVEALFFNYFDKNPAASAELPRLIDVSYEPEVNEWHHKKRPQMRLCTLEAASVDACTEQLRRAFIGEHDLLPLQEKALKLLGEGKSTLAVMATGRGKSLIFQLHAARIALLKRAASIFVLPLRALVNDQAFHLQEALKDFDIEVALITGETPHTERQEIFSRLHQGALDIVLTTPEFLALHTASFAQSKRIGFLVIDEAHHAGSSKGGHRASYQHFPRIQEALGNPCVIAVSATVSTPQAEEIKRLFAIDTYLADTTSRENLFLEDLRDIEESVASAPQNFALTTEVLDAELLDVDPKKRHLIQIVAHGEKTVVYVNSRGQAEALCKLLRQYLTDLAPRIAFYHAGLTREKRKGVEEAFRQNTLSCIVSTSAFGEGVNISDIRRIVLYHMPFGATEFNQMSGRAGRDGKAAQITLLFGGRDAALNERILEASAPSREALGEVYKTFCAMAAMQQETPAGALQASAKQIGEYAAYVLEGRQLEKETVEAALAIFRELGLVEIERSSDGARLIRLKALGSSQSKSTPATKVFSLDTSTYYLEGCALREAFSAFKEWILHASADELRRRIIRPITPATKLSDRIDTKNLGRRQA